MRISDFAFHVSFNMGMRDNGVEFEVGDVDTPTVNFVGNDIDSLAQEVIESDPSFPLIFKRTNTYAHIVGFFYEADNHDDNDEYCGLTAIMYRY